MKLNFFKAFLFIIISLSLGIGAQAQKRLALGVGASLVNGAEEKEELNAFVPVTLYFSYSFINTPTARVAIENFTSFRSKDDNSEVRTGFATALPVVFEYRLSKWSLYTGAGPAYISQSVKDNYEKKIKEDGGFLDLNLGFGKRSSTKALTGEVGLRFHYLKRLSSNREDGFMLSLYLAGPK